MTFSRRQFFDFATGGLGTAALVHLLGSETRAAGQGGGVSAHHPPRARRAIHICLMGGLSQVDSFDYKPVLARFHGKAPPDSVKPDTFFGSAGMMRAHEWEFRQRGQSGLWISELFPHLASVADELTVVRSMRSESANHTPASFLQNTGFPMNGFPSLGSWLSYGLGSETEALPTFIVLPDARSLPNNGASNWSGGFLPAEHQGALFRSGAQPVRHLFADPHGTAEAERDARALLQTLNRRHAAARPEADLLTARLKAYEVAARMQVSVPEAIDFDQEPAHIRSMYGVDRKATADAGRRCLLARRLLERGVRFVQLYSGGAFGGKPRHGWDGHENNRINHAREAALIDQPVAALIKDLKQRGMLEDTLLLFTSEFGRTPFTQAPAGQLGLGRDHNPEGFSVWMAGGGLRRGMAYGATDEVGWRAVDQPVTWPDFHATVLHVLGIDHERLTFYHNGIERRLTNVHGHVMEGIVA